MHIFKRKNVNVNFILFPPKKSARNIELLSDDEEEYKNLFNSQNIKNKSIAEKIQKMKIIKNSNCFDKLIQGYKSPQNVNN